MRKYMQRHLRALELLVCDYSARNSFRHKLSGGASVSKKDSATNSYGLGSSSCSTSYALSESAPFALAKAEGTGPGRMPDSSWQPLDSTSPPQRTDCPSSLAMLEATVAQIRSEKSPRACTCDGPFYSDPCGACFKCGTGTWHGVCRKKLDQWTLRLEAQNGSERDVADASYLGFQRPANHNSEESWSDEECKARYTDNEALRLETILGNSTARNIRSGDDQKYIECDSSNLLRSRPSDY